MKKRVLSILLCLCMVMTLLPSAAMAAMATYGTFTVTGDDLTGVGYVGNVLTISSDKPVTIANTDLSTAITTDRIEVTSEANITLAGVNVDVSGTDNAAAFRITSAAGAVNITLADGSTNTLKSGENCAGLQKDTTAANTLLTIQGGTLGTGSLTATGGNCGAGIGGAGTINGGMAGSYITINGGTVTATGGDFGAGIGGGGNQNSGGWDDPGGSGSYITIGGGTVTATGGFWAAGIGGGSGNQNSGGGDGSHITISGGTVTVTGGTSAAGIGPGTGRWAGATENKIIGGGNVKTSVWGVATNDAGEPVNVYQATFIVPDDTTGGTDVSAMTFTSNGMDYTYNMTGAKSILDSDAGKVYVYLPGDATGIAATASYDSKTYAAAVTDDNNAVFVAPPEAQWGMANDGAAPGTWVGSGTLDEAMNYANSNSGAYIKLQGDVDTTATLIFSSGTTTILDLNGKTIDANDGAFSVLTVNGNLTLCDSSTTTVANQGKITGGNQPDMGGGVYIESDGSFTMTGGNITGNTSGTSGGGVFSTGNGSGNVMTMTGGSITGNHTYFLGGGVFIQSGGFTVGGTAKITDNTSGTAPDILVNNVYLYGSMTPPAQQILTISTATPLTEGASIGVRTSFVPSASSPLDFTGANSADYSGYFTSDNSSYVVQNSSTGNVAQLSVHNLTITTTVTDGYTYTGGVLTFTQAGEYSIAMSDGAASTGDRIVVNAGATDMVTLNLDGVNITAPNGESVSGTDALTITSGVVTLNIVADSTLTGGVGQGYSGNENGGNGIVGSITVSGAAKLTVAGGQSTHGATAGSGIVGNTFVSGSVWLEAAGGQGGTMTAGGSGIAGNLAVSGTAAVTATGKYGSDSWSAAITGSITAANHSIKGGDDENSVSNMITSGTTSAYPYITVALPTAAEYAADAVSGTDYVLDDTATPKTLHIKTAKGAAFWSANGGSYLDYAVYLDSDIDVSGFLWSPVGSADFPFTGTFDGQGHSISGLTIASTAAQVGLFGCTLGATIQNLCIASGSISGVTSSSALHVGGVAAFAQNTTLRNCCNRAAISGVNNDSYYNAYVGGIVGMAYAGSGSTTTISNCYNAGNVTTNVINSGAACAGGVAGSASDSSIIANCYNTGAVTASGSATNNYAGGISGFGGTISYCYFKSDAAAIGNNMTATGCGTFANNGGTLTTGTSTNCGSDQALAHGDALLGALNGWVNTEASVNYYTWAADNGTTPTNDGYPVFGPAWSAAPAITKAAATNGSFIVKVNGNEVSSAIEGQTVAVTPTAATNYELDTITVTKTSDPNTTVTVTSGSFTMPDYPVTVAVSFRVSGNIMPTIDFAATLDPPSHTFDSRQAGYSAITPQIFTIESTGTEPLINLAVSLSDYTCFSLDQGTVTSTVYDSVYCTVTPHIELPANSYSTTLTVTATGLTTISAPINFTVTEGPTVTYTITYDANSGSGSMTAGTATEGRQFTLPTCTFTPPSGKVFDQWAIGSTSGAKVAAGSAYTFTANTTVYARWKNRGGSGGSSSGGGSSPSTTTTPAATTALSTPASVTPASAPVIVDGKTESIGRVIETETTTTVVVDQQQLANKVKEAAEGSSVEVHLISNTDAAAAQFVVENVQQMAAKDMTLVIATEDTSISIPTTAVDTAAVMDALGATDPAAVPIKVTIEKADSSRQQAVNNTVSNFGGQVIGSPLNFKVTAAYDGKSVEVGKFSKLIQRSIEVTAEQAKRITTAIVHHDDGKVTHVPTYVKQVGNKCFAQTKNFTSSTYALIYNQESFADTKGKWYEAIVSEMASRKVVSGRDKNNFDGEANITRAEFATILVNSLGLPQDGNGTVFKDVAASAWYCGTVGSAYEYGIISGRGEGKFDPDSNITRQEAMLMIRKAAALAEFKGASGSLVSFGDAASVSSWAQAAAEWNVGSGLIAGYEDNTVRGQANISRAESATVILKLFQKAEMVDIRTN